MIALEPIERAQAERAPGRIGAVIAALEALERGEGFADAATPALGYNRLASALAAILADRQAAISPEERGKLLLYNTIIANLFAASGFGNAGAALAAVYPFRGLPADPDLLDRFLPLLGQDAPVEVDIDQLLALPPPQALLMALSHAAGRPVLTPTGAARREAVLAKAARLQGLELPATLGALTLLAHAWMNCSYAAQPGRHALKPVLNGLLDDLLRRLGLAAPPTPVPRPMKTRPTMVVAAEFIQQNHVQFRYFGQYLRQLRTRFELILVAPRRQVSPAVPALFDQVFAFDGASPSFLHDVVGFIAKTAPDMLFWPSVGMSRWGPLLANLRLAPIQFTALGHSASTFIPAVDYYLTEAGYVGDPALFSETLLLLPDESLVFEPPPGRRAPEPRVRDPEPAVVRIAVPANALKLNPVFMETLGRVRREARTPVEFHIFPNCGPVEAAALRAAAGRVMGGAIVHPQLPGPEYLDALNACDLALSPFPFGGLHSTVDALRLGLPVVAREGLEPHSRTDAMILRRLGLPEVLITRSDGAYVATAAMLVDDGQRRLEIGGRAIAADVDGRLFAQAGAPLRREVVDAVWAVWRHHEQIQADGRDAWTSAELAALGA